MEDRPKSPGLSDLWRAMARHRKKSFTAFLLVVIIAGATAIFGPKRYHSEGLLLVRLGKENATLDSTVTMGQEPVVALPSSRDNELNSVVEILRSRAVAEKVVDLLGPDFILRHSPAAGYSRSGSAGYSGSGSARPLGRVEQAVDQVRQAWVRSKEFLRRLEGTANLEIAIAPSRSSSRAIAQVPPGSPT